MFGTKNSGGGSSKTKVDFPLEVAVENVTLFKVEPNERIQGIDFTFTWTGEKDGVEQIAFLTDTVLPPKKEWCEGGDLKKDGTVETPEEDYNKQLRQFNGTLKYIVTNCGVPKNVVDAVAGSDFDSYAEEFCKVVNANKTSDALYLKTVKDKKGYTKLPKYRGKGFIAPMSDGYPVFEYNDYEKGLIKEFAKEGIEVEEVVGEVTPTSDDTSSFDAV